MTLEIINYYIFRSYSKFKKAAWETNDTYCDSIKETPLYSDNSGKLLLDIIDMHIFDFITGRNILCVQLNLCKTTTQKQTKQRSL